MLLPTELLIEYFLRFVFFYCFSSRALYMVCCLNVEFLLVDVSSYFHRFLESLPVRLMGRWDMKILFTSYCLRRINHLNLVLSIGTPMCCCLAIWNFLLWVCYCLHILVKKLSPVVFWMFMKQVWDMTLLLVVWFQNGHKINFLLGKEQAWRDTWQNLTSN